MTLNGVMAVVLRHVTEYGTFWPNYVTVDEVPTYTTCDKMQPEEPTYLQCMIDGNILRNG